LEPFTNREGGAHANNGAPATAQQKKHSQRFIERETSTRDAASTKNFNENQRIVTLGGGW
jgi:hypothetical protein